MTYVFVVLVAVCAVVAWRHWRSGIFLMIVIAALQDPIRKTTPDAPAWFVLSTIPVLAASVLGLLRDMPDWWSHFQHVERPLARAIGVFALYLILPTMLILRYGVTGIQLAIMGGLFYGAFLCAIIMGVLWGDSPRRTLRLLGVYVTVTALALIGVPLQYLGLFPDWLALGTEAMEMEWIRHIPGVIITMYAGFYRSPDIMGWHATTALMAAYILANASRRLWVRGVWIAMCGWCAVGTVLCGRRKMAYMLPILLISMLWCQRHRLQVHWPRHALVTGLGLLFFIFAYDRIGPYDEVTTYYIDTADEILERGTAHGIATVKTTLFHQRSGLLGYGLGAASTGGHHTMGGGGRPRAWQEGGVSRLAVELGLPGLILFGWLVSVLGRRMYQIACWHGRQDHAVSSIYVGLFSLIVANGMSFVVSGQIFGDPFIAFFVSLLAGVELSGGKIPRRLAARRHERTRREAARRVERMRAQRESAA